MSSFRSWLDACPLVAILRGVTPPEAPAIGAALVDAGFRIIEVPLNSPDPIESIAALVETVGDRALIGAGTVIDPARVADIAGAGGRLVVLPHADGRVVANAKRAEMIVVPGVATPTEAFGMIELGADALKLFPAEAMSPAVLKAMKAVLPDDLPLLPVGGVSPETMAPWWAAGAAGFGLGSSLYKPGRSADEVGQRAKDFVAALSEIRR